MSPKKAILIVDDDAIMLSLLSKTLASVYKEGYIFKTALSAREGLEIVEELINAGVIIPLIISDWLMPEMKGDEFILKIHELHPEINTMMISGYAAPDVIERICAKLNLKSFITKPWDVNFLISEINKCL